MNRKKIFAAALTIVLCAGMSMTARAAYDPMRAMEEASRQAVEVAIKAGTVPHGTTIYDCAYSTNENGVTIVVRYKDKDGNWIDVTTGKAVARETPPAVSSPKFTEETLAEYADEVFALVNEAREEAGLPPLERDDELDAAAAVRAGEYASVKSIRVDGQSHTRLDGSKFSTVLDEMGIGWRSAGENSSAWRKSPEEVMNAWLASDGHRANIMTENRTRIGIGVRQDSDGRLYWIQLFIKPE